MTFPRFSKFQAAANLLLLAFLLWTAWKTFHLTYQQGDVRTTHFAIEAWHAGLNPYDPDDVSKAAGTDFDLAFIYPPDTLYVFGALHSLGLDRARAVYVLLQLILIATLVACWNRFFIEPGDRWHPAWLAFCLFGLGNTLLIDLRVGNISLIEQNLLWLGLLAWMRGRFWLFAGLLWLAAACKLSLLAFSVLLLLPPTRQTGKFAVVWLAMTARLGLDAWLSPRLFGAFIQALGAFGGTQDGGQNNPCVLEFFKDGLRLCDDLLDDGQVFWIALFFYAIAGVAVAILSWRAWRGILRRLPAGDDRALRLVCLLCLVYALTVPRMKDYSYILLLLPVWRTLKWTVAGKPHAWLGLVLLAALSTRSDLYELQAYYDFIWHYWPLLMALGAWVLLIVDIRRAPIDRIA